MKHIILSLSIISSTLNLAFSQQNQSKHIMNKALLIIDIQNDYFENGANKLVNPEAASANAKLLLDQFRADSLPVIHIQHIATRPTAKFFLPNTKGIEIKDILRPMGNEKVIVKHYPNSFRDTELLVYLKEKGITNLVICGMMTHMCIDATVRAAKDYGFDVELIGDACATKDLEINGNTVKASDVQNSFLAALNYSYATVKTTTQYLDKK